MNSEELRALADAATPGPWHFNDSTDARGRKGEFRAPSPYNGFMLVGPWVNEADPRLIALAPSLARDHAALLERAGAMERVVEAARALRRREGLPEFEALCAALAELDGQTRGGEGPASQARADRRGVASAHSHAADPGPSGQPKPPRVCPCRVHGDPDGDCVEECR